MAKKPKQPAEQEAMQEAFPSLEENLHKLKTLIDVCYFQASEVLEFKENPDPMVQSGNAIRLMLYLRDMKALMNKI